MTVRASENVATLAAPVAGAAANPAYRPAQALLSGATVGPAELGTLAELDTTNAVGSLDFGPTASPARQTALRHRRIGSNVWAHLADAWTTRPPDSGRVLLPGTVTAG